jgi:hypothetical protein
MAVKKPTGGTAMTNRQKIAAQKISSTKPKPTVKTKVQDKVKEVKSAYDKVSKTGIPVKGGPRPKMQRMAQPAKPKRMAQKGR